MNPEPTSPTTEPATQGTMRDPVPVWLFIVLFLLLYGGMVYFDTQGGWEPVVYRPFHSSSELAMYQPLPPEGFDRVRAQKTYESICGVCHQPDGLGKPGQFPPLAGSEWVAEAAPRTTAIPLVGLSGPISIKGQEWNLSMPAMGASLSDEDLAGVLTYIRQSWGNKGSEITPAQVKTVRVSLSGRSQPLGGGAEVLKLPAK